MAKVAIRKKILEWPTGVHLLGQLTLPRCYFIEYVDQIIARTKFSVRLDFCVRDSRVHTKIKYPSSLVKLALSPERAIYTKFSDILTALTVNINHVYMWTDSNMVLQWLNSNDKLPVFVANLIGEILDSTAIDEWNLVLRADNPNYIVHDRFLRKPSRIAAELLARACSGRLLGRLYRTKVWSQKISLKVPSCYVDNCLETSSSFVADVNIHQTSQNRVQWGKF